MTLIKNNTITKFDDASIPIMQQILDDISEQAEGVVYTSTEPTASTVPLGKKVIYDDDAGVRRVYYKTGKDNLVTIPGVAGSAVADATGAGDVVAQLNALLASLRAAGVISS